MEASGTTLTEIFGVGPILAAKIIGTVGNVALLFLTDAVAWFFAYPRPTGGVQPITQPSGFWAAAFLVGLVSTLGLVAIYVRQAEAAGMLGLIGFGVAFLSTALSAGVAWTPTVRALSRTRRGRGPPKGPSPGGDENVVTPRRK